MDDDTPIEGQFSEVTRAVAPRSQTAVGDVLLSPPSIVTAAAWGERRLTPPDQPIPVPAYLGENWLPDWNAIPDRTPRDEIRDALNDKTGAVMYKYVTSGYMQRTLDKVFRGHNWGVEVIEEGKENEAANGDYEYVVVVQIVGPGMFRPQQGVGSNKFQKSNPQDTAAKTRAAAYTTAVKNAAKVLGVGRDLEEADPEFQKLVDSRTSTINVTYERLRKNPATTDAAKDLVRRFAETALLEDGSLLVGQVDFDKLEPLQKELSALAVRAAQAAREAAAPAAAAETAK